MGKILIVEDDALTAMVVKQTLESFDYEVQTVNTGEKALEKCNGQGCEADLILMDINLGSGIDGTQAAEKILENYDIPIVFHSSHQEKEVVEKTEKITSYGYVVKGSSPTVLDASIKMAFKLHEAKKKSERAHKLLDKATENVPGVVYQYKVDSEGNSSFPFATEKIYNVYEVTPEEVVDDASKVFDKIHPEDSDKVRESIWESYRTLSTWECDYRVILPEKGERWLTGQANPEIVEDGVLWHGYIWDSTERKRSEYKMKELLQEYYTVFDSTQDAMFLIDVEGENTFRFRQNNFTHAIRTGMTTEMIKKMTPQDLFNKELSDELINNYRRCIEKREPISYEEELELPRGTRQWYTTLNPVFNNENKIEYIVGSSQDITERKKAEDELRKKSLVLDQIQDRVTLTDLEGNITYVNNAELEAMKATKEETIGKSILDIEASEGMPTQQEVLQRTIEDGFYKGEMGTIDNEGNEVYSEIKTQLIHDEKGNPIALAGVENDVTDLKSAKVEAEKNLQRERTVMKEAHHRMKNSLASIESMISLQKGKVECQESHEALIDVLGRVQSIRLVYDKILETEKLVSIPAPYYFDSFVEAIISVFQNGSSIRVEKDIDNIELSSKVMFALGIIVNEFITNSMKYAFTSGADGKIRLSIKEENEGKITVRLSDDGRGIPESVIENPDSAGFGMILIVSMCQQLSSEYSIYNENGMKLSLTFSI